MQYVKGQEVSFHNNLVLLICIYNLTDDETFNLWDTFNLILGHFYGAIVTY